MAEILRSPAFDGVAHGFSTRAGLAADDILPGANLVLAKQVHSPEALVVEKPFSDAPEGDALVTARPGLLLGIVTADCAPVLFHDARAGVVGAAHAGWRGAHGGVIDNTVAAMTGLGASPADMVAVIGPTIALASYEVDDGFRALFGDAEAKFFIPGREGHWQFDLPGYVAHRLVRAGVGQVVDLAEDTYTQPDRFFSFRRATHRGEPTGGRQLSVIAVPG